MSLFLLVILAIAANLFCRNLIIEPIELFSLGLGPLLKWGAIALLALGISWCLGD
ncbi:MAG: hypothetical protein HC910_01730 [Spirulinaceae cyanobacterium SM2_1_0]|nr:hypothetical protein [Spirulinaceae cyanobacterium SM2_1_0]